MQKISLLCFLDENGTSKLQDSIIKEIEKDFKKVDFKRINGENEAMSKYNIKEFPTILIEVDGEVKIRFSGLTQQLFLRRALDKLIK